MPIFDFKCPSCGTVEDHIVRSIDIGAGSEPLFACSKCNTEMVRVVSAPTTFQFKGVSFSASSGPSKE
jgi:putative FmdB family regulatory protein